MEQKAAQYEYRAIKFESSQQIKDFSAMCRDLGSNMKKELNTAVDFCNKNKILLSDVLEKFSNMQKN